MAETIWADDWESLGEEEWQGGGRSRTLPRGEHLGATLYELPPGATGGLYHFHHGAEELLVMLRGRATLRTPAGERELEEGEVVDFPPGPDGAHQVQNRGDEPVRYLVVSNRDVRVESVEYPDSGQISVMARTASHAGDGPLFRIFLYEDGEA